MINYYRYKAMKVKNPFFYLNFADHINLRKNAWQNKCFIFDKVFMLWKMYRAGYGSYINSRNAKRETAMSTDSSVTKTVSGPAPGPGP